MNTRIDVDLDKFHIFSIDEIRPAYASVIARLASSSGTADRNVTSDDEAVSVAMMTGSDIDRHMNLYNMRPKLKQHILDLYQERQALMSDVESSQKIIEELNEQQQIAASAHQSALKAARAKLNAAGKDARNAENLQEAERAHLEDELLVKEEDAAKLRRKLATMTMSATKQRKRAQRLTDGANETKFDEADVETEQVERDAVIKCVGQQVLDLVVDPHRPPA